jgi:REP element-mobilizing transposase RayT
MTTGYRIEDQYATYYITPTIVDWVDVFSRKIYRDIVVDALNFYISKRELVVYGYVIMTNHMHLIVRSKNGTLSDTIRDLKKYTSRKISDTIIATPESRREWILHRFEWNATTNQRSTNRQVWTHENHPIHIETKPFFDEKLNYLHENPVRAGWVEVADHYVYSSARSLYHGVAGLVDVTPWGF